jgi:hypothetical protein
MMRMISREKIASEKRERATILLVWGEEGPILTTAASLLAFDAFFCHVIHCAYIHLPMNGSLSTI